MLPDPTLWLAVRKAAMHTFAISPFLVWSNYSCGACVVPEEAAEPLSALNANAVATGVRRLGKEQDVVFALMISFAVKVCNVLVQRIPKRVLAEQDQLR
jgi:hypothetical protein